MEGFARKDLAFVEVTLPVKIEWLAKAMKIDWQAKAVKIDWQAKTHWIRRKLA